MSAYRKLETKFNDQQCLVDTLREEGYEVNEHTEPQQLEGYHGDKRQDRAHLIIPRRSVNKFSGGCSNDMGFVKDENGSFKAVISDYDQGRHGQPWLNKIARKYAEKKASKLASTAGAVLTKREELVNKDGKKVVRMTFRAPTAGVQGSRL